MGASSAPYWFSAFFIALMPTSIGYQDLAALFAHQQGIAQRMSEHLLASPFGTIERATFSYARPIGTSMPEPPGYQTVNFDPNALDSNSFQIDAPLNAPSTQLDYPVVDRSHKGDRLPVVSPAPAAAEPASLPQLQPIDALPAAQPVDFAACRAGADVAAQEHRARRQRAADRAAGAIAAVSAGSAIAGQPVKMFRRRRP